MERVRSAKKQPVVTHVAVVSEAQADSPQTRILERARPAKAVPDPAQRPKYMLDGYGEPKQAFRIGMATKSGGAGDSVLVCYREKRHDEHSAVRVYYVGAILVGSIAIAPIHVSAHFRHSLDEQGDALFPTVAKAEAYLRELLQRQVGK